MVKLFFCGDIVYKKQTSQNVIDKELSELIREHDIKCCNFEAPAVLPEQNFKRVSKIGPSHNQTKESVELIKNTGFNLISIANNHIMDYGKQGLESTINLFKPNPVIGAGVSKQEAYNTYIYEKENIRISFLSVAENGFGACLEKNDCGYAWMLDESVEKIIKAEKEKSDYVVVNCHAGAEMFSYPLPEIRKLYKKFIDCGADIIIGHHPHVIQGYEEYKKGIIFYSLGNFIFDGNKPEQCRTSYAVSIKIKNKKEYIYDIIPCLYNKEKVVKHTEACKELIYQYSQMLKKEEYNNLINEFCEKMYKNVYTEYYNSVSGIYKKSIKGKIKSSIEILLGKNKFNDKFLYHNIGIETHLWICNRALKNRQIYK